MILRVFALALAGVYLILAFAWNRSDRPNRILWTVVNLLVAAILMCAAR